MLEFKLNSLEILMVLFTAHKGAEFSDTLVEYLSNVGFERENSGYRILLVIDVHDTFGKYPTHRYISIGLRVTVINSKFLSVNRL
jgi:hypothetical protein